MHLFYALQPSTFLVILYLIIYKFLKAGIVEQVPFGRGALIEVDAIEEPDMVQQIGS